MFPVHFPFLNSPYVYIYIYISHCKVISIVFPLFLYNPYVSSSFAIQLRYRVAGEYRAGAPQSNGGQPLQPTSAAGDPSLFSCQRAAKMQGKKLRFWRQIHGVRAVAG